MKRFFRNRAILAKIETIYGTDAVPTGAANAMQMTNVVFNPSVGQEERRDLVLPYMGHQGVILTGTYATLAGEVEIAGSGTPGTAPAYGPLLRACGMAEVIEAGVDVQYSPVSALHEAVSIYFNADGVRHIMIGARGTFTFQLTPLRIPRFAFTFTGLLGTITDAALPVVNVSDFIKPVTVNKANTTFSLHGLAGATEGVNIDLANQIEPRFLIGSESIEQVDREMTGTATMEAVSLATKNWFKISHSETTGPLAAQHGRVAGNTVAFDASTVQIGRIGYGETQKIINNGLPLILQNPGTGEFTITVR